MGDDDDRERAGTGARVDPGLRKAVPPDEPTPEETTGFEGVPRDWASAADRRANAGQSRFGGPPANEGPPTPASLRRAAAGGTPVEVPAEYGGPVDAPGPAAGLVSGADSAPAPRDASAGVISGADSRPAATPRDAAAGVVSGADPAPAAVPRDAAAGSAAGALSGANGGSAVDLPAEYGGPEHPDTDESGPRDADWAATATDRPLPAADHWNVEDPAAPVEPSREAAEVAVGHVPAAPDPTFKESGEPGVGSAAGVAAAGAGAVAAAGLAGSRTAEAEPDTEPDLDEDLTDARRRPPEDEPAWNRPSGVSPITRSERRASEAAATAKATGTTGMGRGFGHVVWALTRVLLGFVFLWAFLDKVFGFGRSTEAGRAWRDGVSPTTGYLSAVDGTFADFFHRLAGQDWVDWVFMVALAALGVALILGIGMILAAVGGTILLVMMWLSGLPLAANPFVDDHLIYALVIIGIAATGAGLRYSLAPWWRRSWLVRKLPFLR